MRHVAIEKLYEGVERGARAGRPLALYVSVPFCRTKCHFCDWVTEVPVRRLRLERQGRAPYVAAVAEQIRHCGGFLRDLGYRPRVMYWGGGTPTRFEPDELLAVYRALDETLDLSSIEQWSMETTPDLATPDRLVPLQERGLGRLSLGVQSFDPEHLRLAGRSHDAQGAIAAARRIRQLGFSFNIDLISGFPSDTAESWRRTVETTLELEPPHVSIYPYRPTEGTVMAAQMLEGRYRTLDTEHHIAMYEVAIELLTAASYYEYIHGYWVRRPEDRDMDAVYGYGLHGEKLGIGSGADSVLAHHLVVNERTEYDAYLRSPGAFGYAERFSLTNPALLASQLGGALMTAEGIDFARFEALTGLPFGAFRFTPFMVSWLGQLEALGAVFVERPGSIALDPREIHRVYIRYLTATPTVRPLWKQQDLLVQP